MGKLEICGINVEFPFTPYPSQVIYMEKVILSLQQKQNAILESPTGTGKTLCLLCATLAWQKHHIKKLEKEFRQKKAVSKALKNNNGPVKIMYESMEEANGEELDDEEKLKKLKPKIIYSSRTHSQLKQVVNELKNTSYHPRTAIVGSREHLCVDPKISQLKGLRQNVACRDAVKKQKCNYKKAFNQITGPTKNTKPKASKHESLYSKIMDIEELVTTLKEKTLCPFFFSRATIEEADILFMPYNYLIDPVARQSVGISMENSVLIFDEAHNVESIAMEAASYVLTTDDIRGCINEIEEFETGVQNGFIALVPPLTTNSTKMLHDFFTEVLKWINACPLSSASRGLTRPGIYIFEFFGQFGINFASVSAVLSIIEQILELTTEGELALRSMAKLDGIATFLEVVFRDKGQYMKTAEDYRVHIEEKKVVNNEVSRISKGGNYSRSKQYTMRVLNYWCFNPGVAFNEIARNKVHNLILTSGTLSPLQTTVSELGLDFPVRLENDHVIDQEQVWVGVVRTGVTNRRLNSSYQFRSTRDYLEELGHTIVNFTRLVPKGLLVFFPSYGLLDEAVKHWQRQEIWARMLKLKRLFVEPRNQVDFKEAVKDYNETIEKEEKGAVFFAVCRGKVSEGIDFSNDRARAVIITGIPFPPIKDPKIILKRETLDAATASTTIASLSQTQSVTSLLDSNFDLQSGALSATTNTAFTHAITQPLPITLSGNDWYIQQASRAVNQAVGRVIRHRYDYGAIIFLDERFANRQQLSCLSKWLKPYTHTVGKYGEAHRELIKFFKHNQSQDAVRQDLKNVEKENQNSNKGFQVPWKKTFKEPKESEIIDIRDESSDEIESNGQSYVNPELLPANFVESQTDPSALSTAKSVDFETTRSMLTKAASTHQKSLGALLSTSMDETTSSILRNLNAHPDYTVSQWRKKVESDDNETRQENGLPLQLKQSKALLPDDLPKTDLKLVSSFPTIARTALAAGQVTVLYSQIKVLKTTNSDDTKMEAVKAICALLKNGGAKCQTLIDTIPRVLPESMSQLFIQVAKDEGLMPIPVVKQGNDDTPLSFFMNAVPMHKRKKQRIDKTIVTRVKDPQCCICLKIEKKAYAARCGHICCLPCWSKMAENGFSNCSMCRLPFQMDKLILVKNMPATVECTAET